jgi:hypothetical protein
LSLTSLSVLQNDFLLPPWPSQAITLPYRKLCLLSGGDFLMFLTLTPFISSKAFWQPWQGSYLSYTCKSVRMFQGIINQGHHPDISFLEALWCLECFWRSEQTALGSFYPQTYPTADSWLMAKWGIKHLCMEDQKDTGRKKFKCMGLQQEHYPLMPICFITMGL